VKDNHLQGIDITFDFTSDVNGLGTECSFDIATLANGDRASFKDGTPLKPTLNEQVLIPTDLSSKNQRFTNYCTIAGCAA
jgi:hypothetical protein